jgi:hypothetical protein
MEFSLFSIRFLSVDSSLNPCLPCTILGSGPAGSQRCHQRFLTFSEISQIQFDKGILIINNENLKENRHEAK